MAERQHQLGLGIEMHDPIDDTEAAAAALQQTAVEQQCAKSEAARQREIPLWALPLPQSQPRGSPVGNNRPQRRVTLGEQDAPQANYRSRSAINPPVIQR